MKSNPALSTTTVSLASENAAARAASTVIPAVRKHWPLVAACALLCGGSALLISKSLARVYDATALVELNANVIRPLGDKSGDMDTATAAVWWDSQEYYETQYRIIVSQRVLTEVVRNLNLTLDSNFLGAKKGDTQPMTVDRAADILRDHTHVEPVKNSRLFVLHVEDTDPRRARTLCSAIANTYVEQNLQTAITGSSDAVTWLNGQLDHVKKELDQNELALHEFKERNELPSTSINDASNMLRVEMQELDVALTHTKTHREELEARYHELSQISADNPDQLPSSELLASQFLQTLRTNYEDAVAAHGALLAEGKGENHPLVKSALEKVDATKAALLAEVRNIQGAVERDLAVVKRQEDGENGLFQETRKRAVDLNMKEIEYHRLDRSRDQNEKLYAMLLDRMKQADLARMMRVNNIHVVDDAIEPMKPIRPRTAVNVLVGLLLGLLSGLGLSWLRERLDSSLKTPDQLEEKLGLTFLGLLPQLEADDQRGHPRRRGATRDAANLAPVADELIVHARPLSGVAEAARAIRTNLMFMNPDRPYRKLLVTSAAPSEGKTTVACSIAIALAQGGQRVCIVDCDLRRPRLHRIFQRAGEAGVTNVLVGEVSIDDVAKPTGIENLWSIPAGPTPPNPADMLHSERFRKFMQELSERFDRVIIDSPPLVPVTDSAIISTLSDGTVFVIRAFKTSYHLGAQGLRVLRDVDTPVVGAVLNAVNLNKHEYSYYYHYYYYKRDGYGSHDPDRSEDVAGGTASPPN